MDTTNASPLIHCDPGPWLYELSISELVITDPPFMLSKHEIPLVGRQLSMVFLHIMNSFCTGVCCKRCSYSTQLGRAEKVSLSRADGRLASSPAQYRYRLPRDRAWAGLLATPLRLGFPAVPQTNCVYSPLMAHSGLGEQREPTEHEAQAACCHNNNPGASYLLVCPPDSYFEI